MSFIFTPSLALSATWQKNEALGSFSQETTTGHQLTRLLVCMTDFAA
jgi:hypothetical protein